MVHAHKDTMLSFFGYNSITTTLVHIVVSLCLSFTAPTLLKQFLHIMEFITISATPKGRVGPKANEICGVGM
jgi:hypothetical protein